MLPRDRGHLTAMMLAIMRFFVTPSEHFLSFYGVACSLNREDTAFQKSKADYSSIPFVIIVLFSDLGRAHSTRAMLIFVNHFASDQNLCIQQTGLELLQRE